jgi:hypothetical protein
VINKLCGEWGGSTRCENRKDLFDKGERNASKLFKAPVAISNDTSLTPRLTILPQTAINNGERRTQVELSSLRISQKWKFRVETGLVVRQKRSLIQPHKT